MGLALIDVDVEFKANLRLWDAKSTSPSLKGLATTIAEILASFLGRLRIFILRTTRGSLPL